MHVLPADEKVIVVGTIVSIVSPAQTNGYGDNNLRLKRGRSVGGDV